MKSNIMNPLRFALLAISIFVSSCNDDADPVDAEPKLGVVEESFEVNAAYEDTDLLTLAVLQSSGLGLRTQSEADICTNTVVTHNETTKRITIDFGTGCTSPNGVLRKGKVLLSYSGTNFLLPGSSIVTTFDNYEVDGLKIEGTRTITNAGIDIFNKKVSLSVKVENGKVTWSDNTYADYISTQMRVLTSAEEEGYNVSITGTASGKSREGFSYTSVVIAPLLVNHECVQTGVFIPSAGKMDFTVLDITISADLGEGVCDKTATLTYPGGSKEITLE